MTQQSSVRLGVLGAGTVGSALLGLLKARTDLNISLGKVLVRDLGKDRGPHVPKDALTTDLDAVLDSADVVVELIGGVEQATDAIVKSLEAGKKVVTANKAVLAERWAELKPYLAKGQLYFEAAVMAGTPIIGPLTGALRGSNPFELHAILNGTCNYILSQLEQGIDYDTALGEAQRLGYAEADPTLDVEGFDAAHKLSVLAKLAFDPETAWDDVKARTVGISKLTTAHVKEAMEDGGRVRLVGSVYPSEGAWRAEVRPVYLPPAHPLAGSASSRNGMVFRGDAVGEVFISGAGAGAGPTASAVLADIIAALAERPGPSPLSAAAPIPADHKVEVLGDVL